MTCALPVGRGLINALAFSVSNQFALQSFNIAYDPPAISAFSPSSASTAGGTALTLSGTSFDTSGFVYIGGSNCTISTWSHSSIICTIPAGQGTVSLVLVTVGGQNFSTTFSYQAPVLSTILPSVVPTLGGPVVIFGSNFGFATPSITLDRSNFYIHAYI